MTGPTAPRGRTARVRRHGGAFAPATVHCAAVSAIQQAVAAEPLGPVTPASRPGTVRHYIADGRSRQLHPRRGTPRLFQMIGRPAGTTCRLKW